MVDALFSHPRLARIHDSLDADRSDVNTYTDVVSELKARVVLDVGCGTGSLLARLSTTLRFRTEEDLRESLARTGFVDIEIRDLPYAPGCGWLVLAKA